MKERKQGMISEKKPVGKTKNINPGNIMVKAALHISEEKFKFMFEHSIVGKAFTLPSGEIHVNQACCNMLGIPNQHLAGNYTPG
jgi:hypothetical protein